MVNKSHFYSAKFYLKITKWNRVWESNYNKKQRLTGAKLKCPAFFKNGNTLFNSKGISLFALGINHTVPTSPSSKASSISR